jgi:2-phospho-L-lactate guanylyltransferase
VTRTSVVIPLRGLHGGKSRLAPILDLLQRTRLVRSMARHVVSIVLDSGIDGAVYVVTRDPGLDWLIADGDPRVNVLCQPRSHPGMNAAIDLGRQAALAGGAERVLIVPADLPRLTVDDVEVILGSVAPVTIAPDRCGDGTNALLLAATPALFRFVFHFGQHSRRRHGEEADRLGLDVDTLVSPGFQVDLDTPDDWAMLSAQEQTWLLDPRGSFPEASDAALMLEHA